MGPFGRQVPLPRSPEEVSAQWLSGLLAHRYPGIEVRQLEVVELKQSHTTKMRLRLTLNEVGTSAGIADEVCLKANLSGLRTGLICEREARFYSFDLSALPVPIAWYADWDPDLRGNGSGNGLVLMEDLAASPGAFGSSDDHLGVDGVAAGLESLARIHAATWADSRLGAADWLARSMGTENDTEQVAQFWNYIQFNLSDPAYAAVVPDWVFDNPGRLHHALDELGAAELGRSGPRCLVHGDAHQGNSFLRSSGERLWLDWQIVRSGSPWRDVAYFIVGALTVEERRSVDREMVEMHRRHLIAAGAEGVPSSDDVWEQFRRWPAYGAQAWLGNINAWGQHSGVEMVRRQFSAAEDYATFEMLTDGRRARRRFVPGEGALRLAPALQDELDARRAAAPE